MTEPAPPSPWAVEARPRSKRRWIVIGLVVLLLLAVAVFGVSQSSLVRGIGAAAAIYEAAKPDVSRAWYYEFSGSPAEMQVYLGVGVDPGRGTSIGCGIVRFELSRARLADARWVILAASGEPVADSSQPCP